MRIKKCCFLVTAVVCLSASVYSQSWSKLTVGQFMHKGSEDGWFWYEFTYLKDGTANLVYYVDMTHDTLKYNIPEDSETINFCNAILDSVMYADEHSKNPPMHHRGGRGQMMRTSVSLQYTDEYGSVKKKYGNMPGAISVLQRLNFKFYLDQARKKHKELVE